MAPKMSRLDWILFGVSAIAIIAAILLTAKDFGWEPLRYILGVGGVVLFFWVARNAPHMGG